MAINKYQQARVDKLCAMGLIFNGETFIYADINFHWTDIVCMTNAEFDKAYNGAIKRKAVIDSHQDRSDRLQFHCSCGFITSNETEFKTHKRSFGIL